MRVPRPIFPIKAPKVPGDAIDCKTRQNSSSNASEVAWPERLIERFVKRPAICSEPLEKK